MNNHTHHHNGSIVLKVTATITVIFLVAITLNQIILNRHINDTIEENMEETVLRTAEQTENYLSTRVSGSIERLLYFKAESGLDSILANYFANPMRQPTAWQCPISLHPYPQKRCPTV